MTIRALLTALMLLVVAPAVTAAQSANAVQAWPNLREGDPIVLTHARAIMADKERGRTAFVPVEGRVGGERRAVGGIEREIVAVDGDADTSGPQGDALDDLRKGVGNRADTSRGGIDICRHPRGDVAEEGAAGCV